MHERLLSYSYSDSDSRVCVRHRILLEIRVYRRSCAVLAS
jgi:hypothetical protein